MKFINEFIIVYSPGILFSIAVFLILYILIKYIKWSAKQSYILAQREASDDELKRIISGFQNALYMRKDYNKYLGMALHGDSLFRLLNRRMAFENTGDFEERLKNTLINYQTNKLYNSTLKDDIDESYWFVLNLYEESLPVPFSLTYLNILKESLLLDKHFIVSSGIKGPDISKPYATINYIRLEFNFFDNDKAEKALIQSKVSFIEFENVKFYSLSECVKFKNL